MESMLVRIDSTSNWLRPINLSAKRAGERSAGNLHAPFDVAGDGNQLTVRLVRHSQRKRGGPDRSDLRSMAPFLDPTNTNRPCFEQRVTVGTQPVSLISPRDESNTLASPMPYRRILRNIGTILGALRAISLTCAVSP